MKDVDAATLAAGLEKLREVTLKHLETLAAHGAVEKVEYKDFFFCGALGLLFWAGVIGQDEYDALLKEWNAEWRRLRDAALAVRGGQGWTAAQ